MMWRLSKSQQSGMVSEILRIGQVAGVTLGRGSLSWGPNIAVPYNLGTGKPSSVTPGDLKLVPQ